MGAGLVQGLLKASQGRICELRHQNRWKLEENGGQTDRGKSSHKSSRREKVDFNPRAMGSLRGRGGVVRKAM